MVIREKQDEIGEQGNKIRKLQGTRLKALQTKTTEE